MNNKLFFETSEQAANRLTETIDFVWCTATGFNGLHFNTYIKLEFWNYMQTMTWHPVSLVQGQILAHLFLPDRLTKANAEIIIHAINQLASLQSLPVQAQSLPPPPPSPTPAVFALAAETRAVVDTTTAAQYLNRKPQTLRIWASQENGPLRPIRINGRLAWPVAELRRCVGILQASGDRHP